MCVFVCVVCVQYVDGLHVILELAEVVTSCAVLNLVYKHILCTVPKEGVSVFP